MQRQETTWRILAERRQLLQIQQLQLLGSPRRATRSSCASVSFYRQLPIQSSQGRVRMHRRPTTVYATTYAQARPTAPISPTSNNALLASKPARSKSSHIRARASSFATRNYERTLLTTKGTAATHRMRRTGAASLYPVPKRLNRSFANESTGPTAATVKAKLVARMSTTACRTFAETPPLTKFDRIGTCSGTNDEGTKTTR